MNSGRGRTSPRRMANNLLAELAAAAIEYDTATAGGGEAPMLFGARLRLAAKRYAKAARDAGILP